MTCVLTSSQVLLKNRLKYALTGREVTLIVNSRLVKVRLHLSDLALIRQGPSSSRYAHALMPDSRRQGPH